MISIIFCYNCNGPHRKVNHLGPEAEMHFKLSDILPYCSLGFKIPVPVMYLCNLLSFPETLMLDKDVLIHTFWRYFETYTNYPVNIIGTHILLTYWAKC